VERAASHRATGNDDAAIDPDAAFGDADTDLEPPGGEPAPDERTD
jgi:hypothetical protein